MDDEDPVLLRSARVADALHGAAFCCIGAVVLVSPWLFASKEMWWFWSMVAVLSLGCLFSGAATLLECAFLRDRDSPVRRRRLPDRAFAALALCAPFLLYAAVRAQFPSAPGFPLVRMESARSVLLFFTPVALALVVALSGRRRGRAALLRLFLLDTFLLAGYGVWNHFHSNDMNVLWVVPDEFYDFTYTGRISSSFYCPNHFVAWLDIAICILLAGALSRGAGRRGRLLCAAGALLLLPVALLTLSRGGVGALFAGLFLLVPTLGLRGRRPLVRILSAAAVAAAVAVAAYAVRYAAWTRELPLGEIESVFFRPERVAVAADGSEKTVVSFGADGFRVRGADRKVSTVPAADLLPVRFLPSPAATNEAGRFKTQVNVKKTHSTDYAEPLEIRADGTLRYRAYNPLMNRMKGHPFWSTWEALGKDGGGDRSAWDLAKETFWYRFDRGWYLGIALRAWRSNPVWGIGPGQNQHRSTQFAATDDGVRAEPGRPGSLKKPRLLNNDYHLYEVHSDWVQLLEEYGIVGFALFFVAFAGIAVLLVLRQGEMADADAPALDRALPLGVLLAGGVVSIQCLLDFSMQMPCIVWLFGFLVTSAILASSRRPR